jgi:hypothetical protein
MRSAELSSIQSGGLAEAIPVRLLTRASGAAAGRFRTADRSGPRSSHVLAYEPAIR